jgi:RNA polymerase sigma factor (sigma-70 family)
MSRSDEQLMRATKGGDAEAFGEFFERHHALVLAYLLRRSPKDVTADLLAETFTRALVAVHDGRAPRGVTAAPWVLTIARNALVDQHRRGRTESSVREQLALERLQPTAAELEDLDPDLEDALSALPADQREALRARVLDERPYDEIAREQLTSESVVRQRVSRALRRLRTDLEGRS